MSKKSYHMKIPKSILVLILVILSVKPGTSNAQETRSYSTSGGEIIFSWADASTDSFDLDIITRFSPVLNIQWQYHYDLNNNFGLFTGLNIRNVGFIFDDPTAVDTRYKARSYTLGIPASVKIGKMKGFFLFGGYELEFPFNYKQKKFVNEDKVEKITSWFSNRTPTIYQSFFAGFQTPFGTQLKFKYYFTNFFNEKYAADDGNGGVIHPYEGISANVFYVSLSFQFMHKKKTTSGTTGDVKM